jgi:hypothetical protein
VTYRKYALKQGNRIAVRFIKYDIQGVFLLLGVEVLLLRSEKKITVSMEIHKGAIFDRLKINDICGKEQHKAKRETTSFWS